MSDTDLTRSTVISDAIEEWLKWSEDNNGEEYAYISGDLIDDLANFIHIRLSK